MSLTLYLNQKAATLMLQQQHHRTPAGAPAEAGVEQQPRQQQLLSPARLKPQLAMMSLNL
jgi:hypothetical protein